MKVVKVNLDKRSYSIYIDYNILYKKSLFKEYITSTQVLIVTNKTISPLYLKEVEQHLSGINYDVVILPDGEIYKSIESLNIVITKLLENKYSRTCLLVALGGGVIGDLTGFVAACYLRGVDFIQIPTTMLSFVDSSVGGKTAVNHPLGKNMIGAFYQPKTVIIDPRVLSTLSDRQLSAGLAEVIKYGLIMDSHFFCWLEDNIEAVLNRDNEALIYTIEQSCINKSKVVTKDEKEKGLRAILNFGHTFGHAIETALSYKEWLHGEAVACGMLIAAELSSRLGLLSTEEVSRIRKILKRANLPTKIHKNIYLEQMLKNMQVDKKAKEGIIYLILLDEIGKAKIISSYSNNQLTATIKDFLH